MNFSNSLWLFFFTAIVIASNSPDNGDYESVPINGGTKRGYNETRDGGEVAKIEKYPSVGVKKPRTNLFTFEDALRHSFIRALKLDVHEFVNFLVENCEKDPESIDFSGSTQDHRQLFLFLKDIFKDFRGTKSLGTCESSLFFKEFTLYTFNRIQISMNEFLKFLGFKKQSDTNKRVRDVSSGLIADLFYQGTLDLFAQCMEQEEAREKYHILFEWFIGSESRPHAFRYQCAYFMILSLLCDIFNDPLLGKFKDAKSTQSNDPPSALKTAFRKALGLNRSAFKSALDEYCKTKRSPKRLLQPEVVGLFNDFKDYYCDHCYLSSHLDGNSNKIPTQTKIQVLSKGVCEFIKYKLGIKFSVFLTNLGLEIPRKKKGGKQRNFEKTANVADILPNFISELLDIPIDSTKLQELRPRPPPNNSSFATYGGPFVILCVYYELFRHENGQAQQAAPSNSPIKNVVIQSDTKSTQSNDPSSALKSAFRKVLGLDRSAFKSALDEYCKTKKSPKRPLQPEVVGLFNDFKDYYCKNCYRSSHSEGNSKKRIATQTKIQALSKGVCDFIKSKLGIKFSDFLTNLGLEIPQRKSQSKPRNIEDNTNVADILPNFLSELLDIPIDSTELQELRPRPPPNVTTFATFGGPLVILCAYYELFRPENGQAQQAEPSNSPMDIQSDRIENELKPITPDQDLAPYNPGEYLAQVHVDQNLDPYLTQINVGPYFTQGLGDQELNLEYPDQGFTPIYLDSDLDPIFLNQLDEWTKSVTLGFVEPSNS